MHVLQLAEAWTVREARELLAPAGIRVKLRHLMRKDDYYCLSAQDEIEPCGRCGCIWLDHSKGDFGRCTGNDCPHKCSGFRRLTLVMP